MNKRQRKKIMLFQSTHPCRVRHLATRIAVRNQYFNPRTHVGCDVDHFKSSNVICYFNPRTHVGCDPFIGPFSSRYLNFNPRTHVGCDGGVLKCYQKKLYFNPRTHVGCDHVNSTTTPSIKQFQSTHPCRVRPSCGIYIAVTITFQSTHPCRVRLRYSDMQSRRDRYFNPRTHVGCDLRVKCNVITSRISIHAPM